MMIEERLAGLNADEIDNLRVELEKELCYLQKNIDTISTEINKKEREILELRETIRQGKQLVREKRLDIIVAERAFWTAKNNSARV